MGKLKLGPLEDDKPVKISVELPAALHRDLIARFISVFGFFVGAYGAQAAEPSKLVAPMIARFMATDRGFLKAKRAASNGSS